jgi:hypothetical protein
VAWLGWRGPGQEGGPSPSHSSLPLTLLSPARCRMHPRGSRSKHFSPWHTHTRRAVLGWQGNGSLFGWVTSPMSWVGHGRALRMGMGIRGRHMPGRLAHPQFQVPYQQGRTGQGRAGSLCTSNQIITSSSTPQPFFHFLSSPFLSFPFLSFFFVSLLPLRLPSSHSPMLLPQASTVNGRST